MTRPKKICEFHMPFTDDEGNYECFLCVKDFNICDKKCNNHKEKISRKIKRKISQFKDWYVSFKLKVERTIYIWTKK